MSEKTGIEWTDSTWSPIRVRVKPDAVQIARLNGYSSLVQIAEKMRGRVGQHCEHVSPGCEHCYAGANNHRCLPGNGTGLPYDRRSRYLVEAFIDGAVLLEPLKWNARGGRKVFVENQSDLFGEWVTDEMLDRVFWAMALSDSLTFQVLTKRPERALKYLAGVGDRTPLITSLPHKNVWLGVSVENQKAAEERIPLLLKTPAAVRFISAEPLLGPIQLDRICDVPGEWRNCLAGSWRSQGDQAVYETGARALDWVICGGESGPGARPMEPKWARWLRDQCADAGVAFFMKQMGSAYGPRKGAALPADLAIRQFPRGA